MHVHAEVEPQGLGEGQVQEVASSKVVGPFWGSGALLSSSCFLLRFIDPDPLFVGLRRQESSAFYSKLRPLANSLIGCL